MTDGTQKALNIWKKTYGFDYAYWVPGKGKDGKLETCQAHCLEAEYGKHDNFASNCKKSKINHVSYFAVFSFFWTLTKY